ncbi:unnamed protein product [Lathyrus sativus]|nr:unnamed protein product [Lathyrus sativus]
MKEFHLASEELKLSCCCNCWLLFHGISPAFGIQGMVRPLHYSEDFTGTTGNEELVAMSSVWNDDTEP